MQAQLWSNPYSSQSSISLELYYAGRLTPGGRNGRRTKRRRRRRPERLRRNDDPRVRPPSPDETPGRLGYPRRATEGPPLLGGASVGLRARSKPGPCGGRETPGREGFRTKQTASSRAACRVQHLRHAPSGAAGPAWSGRALNPDTGRGPGWGRAADVSRGRRLTSPDDQPGRTDEPQL